jgi:phosphoserine phosphatase RsbU/P
VSDVNRQLAADVEDSGHFMTMFFLAVDLKNMQLQWVRAGHDPAVLYDPLRDEFELLDGSGLALAVDKSQRYIPNQKETIEKGQIVLLGTDGIWEARNPERKGFRQRTALSDRTQESESRRKKNTRNGF